MLTKILAGGGLAAALAAATCCVLLLSLGAIGVGGAWASTFSPLAPYQTAFRVLAVLLLGAAFWLVYGQRASAASGAAQGAACPVVPSQGVTKSVLWIGAAVMGLVLSYGWWERFIA